MRLNKQSVCCGLLVSLVMVSATAASSDEKSTANSICVVAGQPASNVQYEIVRRVKRGKNTYGSPAQILPAFATQVRALGADAVIDYQSGQRFGFWPWRVVRPVVYGTAVRWRAGQQIDCHAIGGFVQTAR